MNHRTVDDKLQQLEDELCLSPGSCTVPVKTLTLVPNGMGIYLRLDEFF
jgi:hypothetical protein